MSANMEAKLVLEDGSLFQGSSRGAKGEALGEVIFNTSMTGYQEIITDPSSCGHILTMTFPLMGNYGINKEDFESRSPFLRGFVAREICPAPSNWRSVKTLGDYLQEQNIIAMDDVDTRALARLIREKGSMRGIITTEDTPYNLLLEKVRKSPPLSALDLVSEVTAPEIYTWENSGPHLVILDLGLKLSLARLLLSNGCRITVVPATLHTREIMELKPDGLVLSGGPGDPRQAGEAIKVARELAGRIPLLGLSLGHLVIALALGGKTYKLKFGHRGTNHPVKDLHTNHVYITSQNHGYAVEEKSLPAGLTVTHRHLHDGTVEGFEDKKLKITTYQYSPEDYSEIADPQHPFNLFWKYLQVPAL
jgi:carbamoyl-phosphate synthase small subunit